MSIATGWDDAYTGAPAWGPDTPSVLQLLSQRKAETGLAHEAARIISQTYGGHIAIANPEIDKTEPLSVANLLCQGIDQYALRICSVTPEVTYWPTKPGQPKAEQAARTKRRATYGWWEVNDMPAVDEKRARWLVAYATAPVLIRPDRATRQPRWEPRTSLETYPSTPRDSLDIHPDDCVFAYLRTFDWLARDYPAVAAQVAASRLASDKPRPEDSIEIVEYVDDQVRVLIAVGQGRPSGIIHEAEYGVNGAVIYNLSEQPGPNHWAVELQRLPNRAGICPVVIPRRMALDGQKGQFDDAIGIFQLLAKIQAMNVNAIAKSVWPEMWMIARPNEVARVVKPADGLRGKVGHIEGAAVQVISEQPSPQVMNMLNYLERAIRLDSLMPSEFGGESPTNVRTDRRGLTVESATVDYMLAAYQRAMARSKKIEIQIAQQIDLAYFGNTKKSFFVDWHGDKGRLDYTPKLLWDDGARDVRVNYAFLGMDANAATVRQGQLVGMGALSLHTVRALNPDWIEDPEQERGRVWGDQIDKAVLAQMMAPGAITVPDLAAIKLLVIAGTPIEQAINQVHEQAQARQASSGPPGTPEGPVPPGSPQAQPGLAQPGQGQEQPVIGPLNADLTNYRHVLQELGNFRSAASAA